MLRTKWTAQPLPARPEDRGQRVVQARVRVGDRQLHAHETTGDQAAQQLRHERLGLGRSETSSAGSLDSPYNHG